MATCPECGSNVPDSFAECPTCGSSLNASADGAGPTEACPHCGEQIASGLDACPACGDLHISVNCSNHPDRAAKGQCVICGDALCADCNEGGERHFLCAEHSKVPVVQGWAQVYSTSDDLEAQLIRDNLEASGVDAQVLSQKDHFALPVDMGELSQVRVLVPAYAFLDACEVIAEHSDADGEVRFGDEEAVPPA